jgi:type IV secretory pathway ATPase VirB11/archaellum biosynthesis ATPase
MTNPNTHIDELNKVIQVMTNHAASIPNTHIDELNKVIQVMTNPKIHI